jgi:hypothetical protein
MIIIISIDSPRKTSMKNKEQEQNLQSSGMLDNQGTQKKKTGF